MRDSAEPTIDQQRAAALQAVKLAARHVNREWLARYRVDGSVPYRPRALLSARERAHELGCSVGEIREATGEVLG